MKRIICASVSKSSDFYNYLICATGWNYDYPMYFDISHVDTVNSYGVRYSFS